jgi:HNH endonuclease
VNTECETCGKSFRTFPSRAQRFCSRKCSLNAPLSTYRCQHCGAKFQPANRSQDYCSFRCRFYSKIDMRTPTECWEWQASRHEKGYGWFRLGGKMRKAHTVAYEYFKGEIPAGLLVCHECDNPACCNPNHLWVGTVADNTHDMIRKGRNYTTPKGSSKKLTPEDAVSIRDTWRKGKTTMKALAQQYGVSISTIQRVLAYHTHPNAA